MRLLASRRVRRALTVLSTLGAFAYLASIVDRHQLLRALAAVSFETWMQALALSLAALGCGVVRWWLLFRAFAAPRPPALAQLARHYFIGLFYNTYLPGGASGDVVRGLATRDAFGSDVVGALATVVLERALGLCALLGLCAGATLAHPLPGLGPLALPALLAFLIAIAGVIGLALFGRTAAFAPPRLRRWIARLPVPAAWTPLALALAVSFGSQLAPALCGHLLLRAIYPSVALADSLLIVPLAAASAFLPISVSGAGVRETVFVTLYGRVGAPADAALAASLCLWAVQACLASFGGLLVLVRAVPPPLDERHPQV